MSKVSQENGKRGLIGPILTLATVVFFLVAGIYFVIAPTRESKRLEQSLIDQYGWANEYTPQATDPYLGNGWSGSFESGKPCNKTAETIRAFLMMSLRSNL